MTDKTDSKWYFNGVEFNAGDTVKVTGFEEAGAAGAMGEGIDWDNGWVDQMDGAIGRSFMIQDIDETGAMFSTFIEEPQDDVTEFGYRFPLSVLQKVHA